MRQAISHTPLVAVAALPSLLVEPRRLRSVGPDIYSILPPETGPQMYDGRAAIYDRVVGSRLYNQIAWGTSPEDFAAFARQAVLEAQDTWLLDAGGGSLLFTAELYLENRSRPILVLDQSIAMLELARRRLIERTGGMPEHVVLVQGDLRDLDAFFTMSIGTILSLNVLHHIEAGAALVSNLGGLLVPGAGSLYLTSLIVSGRWSDLYLEALFRSGVLVRPRSEQDVEACFAEAAVDGIAAFRRGNVLYVTARLGKARA